MSQQTDNLTPWQESLKRMRSALSAGTYWRWFNGELPAFGQFLLEHPDLAQSLADTARKMKETDPCQEAAHV